MKISEALEYLAGTDETYGWQRGHVAGLEYRIKSIEATGYLNSDGTQEQRKAMARTDQAYLEMINEYENAKIDLEVIAAKRKTAELHIEVWRTQQANKRQGNI